MLTTVDNPFSPFTQYNEWCQWDESAGYNSNALLARVVRMSDELSESDQDLAIKQGIEEIVSVNASGVHRMVSSSSVSD